ncbi:phosphoinositide 3-kinase regulatory subunit 6 isoform X2 [Brachyhypopomus gauderio]|uniref:phosphoinositide 3-kinase regulatory subunit 6 isoform X2 n=1 Tax=Brachyhypopomus gauderio TaxID=698409 RepID=UPI0040429033
MSLSVRMLAENTVGGVSSAVESSLYQRVHAVLRELDTDTQPGSAGNKGMLRWTLHKKVENNPYTSVSLLRVLLKELEKADKVDYKIRIIPLLHTLLYAIMQSVYVPADLCERVYVCLKRLVTLPEPYCSVGLNYAKYMKIERKIPGALYLRRVVAEHSLKNEHYTLHERVFVFADPAVFPLPLLNAVRAEVEGVASGNDPQSHQRKVLLHTLQAGLGRRCHGRALAQALGDLGEDVERFFQDVVSTVEESIEDGGSDSDEYSTRLQQIYHDIVSSADKEQSGPACLIGSPLPSPEISFHIWTKEDEIWNEVVNFILMVNPAEHSSAFLEEDGMAKRASVTSTMSIDSGIEGDLPLNELSSLMVEPSGILDVQEQLKNPQFFRRSCVRWPRAGNRMTLMMEAIKEYGGSGAGSCQPKEEKNFTARIVVMGDDRTMGRLGRTYHNIRKREARHIFLTKRVNLEIYYIPVSSEPAASPAQGSVPAAVDMLTIAGSLGCMDPWYDCNINSLGDMILKLAKMSQPGGSSEPNSFLPDIISYYTRTAQQPVQVPIYSVKISFSGVNSAAVQEVFVCQLHMNFTSFRPLRTTFKDTIKGSVRYKKCMQENSGVTVSVNYKKASISNRELEQGMTVVTCDVLIRAVPYGTKHLDSLSVDICDPNPTRSCVATLRVSSICIRVLEEKTFTLCLDKDSTRTFKNVQSIEVCSCTDPGYCLQKPKGRQTAEAESGLSRYLSKTFSLPINTFSGTAH